jgi:hypothetical protein
MRIRCAWATGLLEGRGHVPIVGSYSKCSAAGSRFTKCTLRFVVWQCVIMVAQKVDYEEVVLEERAHPYDVYLPTPRRTHNQLTVSTPTA